MPEDRSDYETGDTLAVTISPGSELENLRKRRVFANAAIQEMTMLIYGSTEGELEDALCEALGKIYAAVNGWLPITELDTGADP